MDSDCEDGKQQLNFPHGKDMGKLGTAKLNFPENKYFFQFFHYTLHKEINGDSIMIKFSF
jgi:hypothetical protein